MSEEKINCFNTNENKKLSLESVEEQNAGDNLNQEELSEKMSVERPEERHVEMLIERSVDISVNILEEMAKELARNENEEGFSDSITLDGRGEQILKYQVNYYTQNDSESDAKNNVQNESPNSSRNVLKNLRTESVLNYFKNDSSISLNSERIMEDYLTRIVDGLFLFTPSKPTFAYNFSDEIK